MSPGHAGAFADFGDFGTSSNMLGLMVRRRAIAGAACVNLAAMRAVSNHGSRVGLAAILRDALASLGLLRMRWEWWIHSL